MGNQGKMERNSGFVWKFERMKSIHDMQCWVFSFMNSKVHKVESCTVYFALNFPPCCPDYP